MRYIQVDQPGGPEVMSLQDGAAPVADVGEVLIEVQAAGVNRPDLMQRQGVYPPPEGASPVLGLEVAGRIVALGEGSEGWSVGDEVCALVPGGGYAELVRVPAGHCLPKPAGLSWIEAAALPETLFTVWNNLFMRAGLRPGETCLVHGGSGGIGSTAIQMAKAWGASVYTTAGGPDKVRFCEELGATRGIDYRHEDFVSVIKQATGGRGVDVILDMVGGEYLRRNQKALAVEGRLVMIACMQGRFAELDLMGMMLKRQQLTGSTLRAQSNAAKAEIAAQLKREVWPWIESGRLRPVVHQAFPLAQAELAHALMESGQHIGKLVLCVGGEA